MSSNNQESMLCEILRGIEREVKALRKDHNTAAIEHDDFAGELTATLDNWADTLGLLTSRIEDMERSHAALCRRVDRLQGCR